MSIGLGAGQHPLLACAGAIDGLLDAVASVEPMFMATREKKAAPALIPHVEHSPEDISVEVSARQTRSQEA
jgi:hypothetical protein